MDQLTLRKYGRYGQIGLIAIFFLINYVENLPYSSEFESIIYSLNYTMMIVGVVYVHYIYLIPLYLSGKQMIYVIATLFVMTIFIFLYNLIDLNLPFEYELDEESFFGAAIIYDYLLLILAIAYSSLYYFFEQWISKIQTEGQLKNEKLQAELNFLKSQINPHFLFNTLNNIYSYAQTGNQKTAPMLERLASILRFMVYDCSEEKVELTKEVVAIEDLLEIQKMKNSEQRNIQLAVEGVKKYHLIAPLIIVNFVENACKHSDVISNKNGFIRVHISVDNSDNCLLQIANSKKNKHISDSKYQGMGLKNIKKRLDLQYPDAYLMEEENSESEYRLTLKIKLERKE